MKKLMILLLVLVSCHVMAQDDTDTSTGLDSRSYSEFGLNATPLVLQLLPFQSVDSRSGPFGFVYKHFGGNHGIKVALGGNIDLDTNGSYLNLSIGYEHKKDVGQHWSWYQSYDFLLSGGSLNLPSEPINDDNALAGISFGLGGEYRITPHVAVGTEASFIAGFSDGDLFSSGDIVFKTIPPIAIYLRFRKF